MRVKQTRKRGDEIEMDDRGLRYAILMRGDVSQVWR